jgi:hypothetical protein
MPRQPFAAALALDVAVRKPKARRDFYDALVNSLIPEMTTENVSRVGVALRRFVDYCFVNTNRLSVYCSFSCLQCSPPVVSSDSPGHVPFRERLSSQSSWIYRDFVSRTN